MTTVLSDLVDILQMEHLGNPSGAILPEMPSGLFWEASGAKLLLSVDAITQSDFTLCPWR